MIDLSKMGLGDLDLSMLPPSLLGRLSFEHKAPTKAGLTAGYNNLGLADERDAMLYVPESVRSDSPAPLLVMFHGANGSADKVKSFLQQHADEQGFLLLLPQSLYATWDLTVGGNGPDLERLNQALAIVADHYLLDRQRFGFAGFSDGASYSLSIGVTNGDLVTHVIAMSGGFMNVYKPAGVPAIFIAHSPEDEQLPIDSSGRKHAKMLTDSGYDVQFHEFHGSHVIHPEVVEEAVKFFTK